MSEDKSNESGSHFVLPPAVLYLLLGATGLGGGGLYGVVEPQLEKDAIAACYTNANIALDVAGQHGQELVEIRGDITSLRNELYARTQYRWTTEDQAKHERKDAAHESTQDRRIDLIERQVEK